MFATPERAAEPTLCLCMMVCNEEHVIARALRSVRSHIEYWVICDNGSTDATVPEIINAMSGVPGQLHRTTWVNFGHNRQRTLSLASGKGDYLLILDADMVLNVHAPFKHKLSADAYQLRYEGASDYGQSMLVASRLPWQYVGVTHEYITAPGAIQPLPLAELTLTHHGDGGMRWRKFERDEELLRASISANPANARDVFYLAQTYFDTKRYAEALPLYRQRAVLPGWDEETWYSLYRIGACLDLCGEPEAEVLAAYAAAFETRPWRLEPLHCIVKKLKDADDHERAYQAGKLGLPLPYPKDVLFIDRAVHEYAFLLSFAESALQAGYGDEAAPALARVLEVPHLPVRAYEHSLQLQRQLSRAGDACSTRHTAVHANDTEFFQFAARLEHDTGKLKAGEEQVTFCQAPDIHSVRPLASHATPEERARRKETFFHPAIAARRSIGQGRHDLEEAITFAGADRDPNDHRTFGLHLPLHLKKQSVRHKVVQAGESWDVSLRGDRWGLHPMEDVYVLLNIGTLVLQQDAELVVRGNVLSLLCQRVICSPGSRIAILPTPFSVDARTGPHDGVPGKAGSAGMTGADGIALQVGGSILGPCFVPEDMHSHAGSARDGQPGGAGDRGEPGTHGRNGGMAKLAELTFRSVTGELTIFAEPGTGGKGGDGGIGGSGGSGGCGAQGRQLLTATIEPGRGGDGAAGGDGGRGGHGGHGGLCSNIYVSVPSAQASQVRCIARPGLPGAGGSGGSGGAGGAGGYGGSDPRRQLVAEAGATGPAGKPGRAGVNGHARPAPWIFLNEERVHSEVEITGEYTYA